MKPVELYRFTQGLFVQGFTTANVPIFHQGVTYEPTVMERSTVGVTDDVYKSSLTLSFARTVPFALNLLGFSNEMPYQVSVFRGEVGGTSWVLNWQGRVISSKANGDIIDVECESLYTTIQRPGLRARYAKTCRHELYDHACGIDYEASKVAGTVAAVDNVVNFTIPEAAGYPNGHFTAGILDLGEEGGARFITNHVGDLITINRPIPVMLNQAVFIAPGCDHLRATCQDKFDNLLSFGGFPWIPDVNPFGGGRIQ
ncbi:tail assembly protein [Vibrio phage 033B]|nr:tail assembly protein [Vibrio phage 033B]